MSNFQFNKLDERTRKLMAEEIQLATGNAQLYFSARFTDAGTANWPPLLLDAAQSHDEHWLAFQLEDTGAMKQVEARAKPKGGYTTAHVPDTAAETLADGQFNRFYIAAICRRAIEDGQSNVKIYRAKRRDDPRSESRALEGTSQEAQELLNQVRSKDGSLKCSLLRPNSGLSVDY
jgi:hypothetical protein